MSVAIFFLLAAIVAGAVVYPLLPGRTTTREAPVVTNADIERAVRDLRRGQAEAILLCPACGNVCRAGDHFCVRCGGALPQTGSEGSACPSCGAPVHESDQFCAKCGHSTVAAEAA